MLCLLLTLVLSACYTPQSEPASATRHHSFIRYWPPPPGDKRLKLAVKDLIDMKGVVTTAGSQYIAQNGQPAARDAKCLARARADKNVVIVGKTNLTEFAVSVSGVNEYYGTPRNTRHLTHRIIPGGSSSGSATAVEHEGADVAFGTDTAGSIRVPAACCGIYGLKTTYGLVSLDGVFPLSPKHLDTVGPMAGDLPNLVKGMDLLEDGFQAKYEEAKRAKPSGKTIRVGRLYLDGTSSAVDKAVDDALTAAHFQVVKLDDHFKDQWVKAQKEGMTISMADAWQSDHDYGDKSGVNIITKAVIALGKIEYQLNYADALKFQMEWKRTMKEMFKHVDFIALPTLKDRAPSLPFFGGTSVLFELHVFNMQNTVPVNMAGNPALAMPIAYDGHKDHNTSLQLIGPDFSEAQLINAARLVESRNGTVQDLRLAEQAAAQVH